MEIDDILARLDKKELSIFEESVRNVIERLHRENQQLRIRNTALANTLRSSTDLLKAIKGDPIVGEQSSGQSMRGKSE